MNIINDNENEYFKKLVIEIGILLEDIVLPELPKDELSLEVLQQYAAEGKTYNLIQNCYTDMVGKFYIPSWFPLIDRADGPEEFIYSGPKINKSNGTLKPVDKYIETNYLELIIPKFIVMGFRDVIPKNTYFLIGFNGEEKEITNLNIIGLYGAGIDIKNKILEEI